MWFLVIILRCKQAGNQVAGVIEMTLPFVFSLSLRCAALRCADRLKMVLVGKTALSGSMRLLIALIVLQT